MLLYLLLSGLFQPYVDYGDDVQWMVSLSSLLLCAFIAMLRQARFEELLGVTDDTLGALLLSGTFDVDDPASLIGFLEATIGVQADYGDPQRIRLTPEATP